MSLASDSLEHARVTVADAADVQVAPVLATEARMMLGLNLPLRVEGLGDRHRAYLPWHGERILKKAS